MQPDPLTGIDHFQAAKTTFLLTVTPSWPPDVQGCLQATRRARYAPVFSDGGDVYPPESHYRQSAPPTPEVCTPPETC